MKCKIKIKQKYMNLRTLIIMNSFEDFVNKNKFVINCGDKKDNELIKEQLFRQILSNVNPSGELLYFTHVLSESLNICDEIVNTSKNANNKFHVTGNLTLQNNNNNNNNKCEQLKNKINFLLQKSKLNNKIIIDDVKNVDQWMEIGNYTEIVPVCGFNVSNKK